MYHCHLKPYRYVFLQEMRSWRNSRAGWLGGWGITNDNQVCFPANSFVRIWKTIYFGVKLIIWTQKYCNCQLSQETWLHYCKAKSMEETKTIFIVMVKLVLFKQKITWALFHSHRASPATPSSWEPSWHCCTGQRWWRPYAASPPSPLRPWPSPPAPCWPQGPGTSAQCLELRRYHWNCSCYYHRAPWTQ